MTTIQAITIQAKQFLLDFTVVLGLSLVSDFWAALTKEFSVGLLVHILVLLTVAIFVKLVGRWIGEEIDSFSDVEFMARFACSRSKFEELKDPNTHGTLFRQNIKHIVFDGNKLRVESKFMGIKTMETFQVLDKGDVVELKNIGGKYESYATYTFDGSGIVCQFVAKPKGVRRALSLLFLGIAKRTVIQDFTKFVNK